MAQYQTKTDLIKQSFKLPRAQDVALVCKQVIKQTPQQYLDELKKLRSDAVKASEKGTSEQSQKKTLQYMNIIEDAKRELEESIMEWE